MSLILHEWGLAQPRPGRPGPETIHGYHGQRDTHYEMTGISCILLTCVKGINPFLCWGANPNMVKGYQNCSISRRGRWISRAIIFLAPQQLVRPFSRPFHGGSALLSFKRGK